MKEIMQKETMPGLTYKQVIDIQKLEEGKHIIPIPGYEEEEVYIDNYEGYTIDIDGNIIY